jgi:hypothetical protein
MPAGTKHSKELWVMFALLFTVISLLLGGSYLPGQTQFSNDGPLARLVSQCHHLPDSFTGVWEDLNTIGYREQGASPDITFGFLLLAGPVIFSKFYVPLALMILGLGAWCFFRELGLAAPACILGGLAAALNGDFFSTACWGVAADPITVGMCFFAMALLIRTSSWRAWVRAALAGIAVGLGLAEGADVGALFSLYVAAFAMYQAWIQEGPRVKNLALGCARVGVVALFAAFLAAQAIFALVSTQIEGVRGAQQDTKTREERWDWATQWSLPKAETLSLIVPGLFGYRIDTLNGGNYWGAIGRSPEWEKYLANGQEGKKPTNLVRQTGSGFYAGVTVVVLAVWAGAQSLRRKNSVFDLRQRRWLWFWMAVAVISLLLAFGRHAPFYRIIYALPYFSTIRNPVKFLAQVNLALVVLSAYGVDGLWRQYLLAPKPGVPRLSSADAQFNKGWLLGCAVTLGISLLGWGIYASDKNSIVHSLVAAGAAEIKARGSIDFSLNQIFWFVLFFILTCGLIMVILRRGFTGSGINWGVGLLGLVLVIDLARADLPWIITWDYGQKYASNPVIDILRDKPYAARVALEPYKGQGSKVLLDDLYHYEWAQQQFQYYNIESLDIVQLPRIPADLEAFQKATHFDGTSARAPLILRRWELTNTRYMMGAVEYLEPFNNQFDPLQRRFHILTRFNIIPRPYTTSPRRLERVTAQLAPNGDYAIFEFDGGLPRAKLYSNWEIITNRDDVLQRVISPSFVPAAAVVVEGGVPTPPGGGQDAGTVDFVSYLPKRVVLNANAATNSVLLLNDRYDSNWKVLVDGQPAPLLRCNYLMRGVYLQPGAHKVEFHFQPPTKALYVSLAAAATGVLLLGVIAIAKPKTENETSRRAAAPASAPRPNNAPNSSPEAAPARKKQPEQRKKKQIASKGKR